MKNAVRVELIKSLLKMSNPKAYVIQLNDFAECIVLGTMDKAEAILDERAKAHYARTQCDIVHQYTTTRATYEEYRRMMHWHIREVECI